jgi:hypothetical protein
MTAVQTMVLLGTFYVYHGKPNLSFSLLGATVKSAHAAGLHKSSRIASKDDMEERKRVWWTIYTWDRSVDRLECRRSQLMTELDSHQSLTADPLV